MISQHSEVVPPLKSDEGLGDFAGIIQGNMEQLFGSAHTHDVRTTAPASTDGNIGDLLIVTLSGTSYLYAKVSATSWKRVALS